MKNCNQCEHCRLNDEEILEKISANLLTDQERIYYEEHLQTCARCNSYIVFSSDLQKKFKESTPQPKILDDFFILNKGIILGKIQQEKIIPLYRKPKFQWAVAAVIIFAFLWILPMKFGRSSSSATLAVNTPSYENFFKNYQLLEKPVEMDDKQLMEELQKLEKNETILQDLLKYDYKKYHHG